MPNTTYAGILLDAGGAVFNVDHSDFGAKGDVKSVTGGAMTASSATLTASGAGFTAGDVGKTVAVRGAGSSGVTLVSTISAFTSSSQVTLATTASTTVSSAAVMFGTNDSAAIQAALNAVLANGGTVVVPAGDYFIDAVNGPLSPRSYTRLVLAPGTVLRAIPNASQNYEVIAIYGKRQVHVQGGVIQGDRDWHMETEGEWGHGIVIGASHECTVEDVLTQDCWGDGLIISPQIARGAYGRPFTTETNCTRCAVRRSRFLRGRRQGISLTGCTDVLIEDCEVAFTGGPGKHSRGPWSGIDIETDYNVFSNTRVTLSRVHSHDNDGVALIADVSAHRVFELRCIDCTFEASTDKWSLWMSPNTPRAAQFDGCAFRGPLVHLSNLQFNHCRFYNDGSYSGTEHILWTDEGAGSLEFNDCYFHASGRADWMHFINAVGERIRRKFSRCTFEHEGNHATPVELATFNDPITFDQCSFHQIGAPRAGGYKLPMWNVNGTTGRMRSCYIDPAFNRDGSPTGWITRDRTQEQVVPMIQDVVRTPPTDPLATLSQTFVAPAGMYGFDIDMPYLNTTAGYVFLTIVADAEDLGGHGTATFELYNTSDNASVPGTEITISYSEPAQQQRVAGPFTLPWARKEYQIRAKASLNMRARLYYARIHIVSG